MGMFCAVQGVNLVEHRRRTYSFVVGLFTVMFERLRVNIDVYLGPVDTRLATTPMKCSSIRGRPNRSFIVLSLSLSLSMMLSPPSENTLLITTHR
jgi:hypothetical protein